MTIHFRIFFLKLIIFTNNIQNLIDNKMKECDELKRLSKYLFLSILRYDGIGFNNKYIDINTFIEINEINYQFFGAVIFEGEDKQGHYTTLIKFDDKHVLFDDDNVSPLFITLFLICAKKKKWGKILYVYF